MSQDGAQVEKSIKSEFTDTKGVKYSIDKFLGKGAEGKAFEGTILDVGPNGDKSLIGKVVAVKQMRISEEKKEAMDMEIDLLEKEGSLFGTNTVQGEDGHGDILYMAIPILKGKTLREAIYDVDPDPNAATAVRGKGTLTTEEKKNISYSLLKDYASQHLLSILHVDIKPDNMLYDPKTGIVKVIDFGNAYDLDLFSEHPSGFQSPGATYAAQENYAKGSPNKCSLKADEYAIGMLIASMWTDACYEKDAKEVGKDYNMALNARETLNDILGPDVKKPKDMPEDLFKIVRHLAAINPADRPETIGLADGIKDSVILKDIRIAQQSIDNFRRDNFNNIGHEMRQLADPKQQINYDQNYSLNKKIHDLDQLVEDPLGFTQKLQECASAKELSESSRKIIEQILESKDTPHNQLASLRSQTHTARSPTTSFSKVFEGLATLKDIDRAIREIDNKPVSTKPNVIKNRARDRAALVDEFNKSLSEIRKSTDLHTSLIFGEALKVDADVAKNEADPTKIMELISAQEKKVLPKLVASALEDGSIHLEVENHIKHIINSSKEPSTMRTEMAKLYGDVVLLAMHEPALAKTCQPITAKIENTMQKLDTVRFNEARILQGKALRKDDVELKPVVLSDQYYQPAVPLAAHKRGMWSRIKSAFKELIKGPKVAQTLPLDAAQTPTPVQEKASLQVLEKLDSILKPTESVANLNVNAKSNDMKGKEELPDTFNPLDLGISQHAYLPMPLPTHPNHVAQTDFVKDCMVHTHEIVEKLIKEYEGIKIEDNMPSHERLREQKQKDFLLVEIKALINLLGHLINNPNITIENKSTAVPLAATVGTQLQVIIDANKKLDVESGLGDQVSIKNPLTRQTQELLRDILQDLKQPAPSLSSSGEKHLHH